MEKKAPTHEVSRLDPNRPVPLHYQLQQILKYQALHGNLADITGKLPTEAELSETFNVSRITVRRALKELEDQGLLSRERGRGTFLKAARVEEHWTGQLLGFSESLKAAGFSPDSRIVKQGLVTNPPGPVKETFAGEAVWELQRLRLADHLPVAIEHAYFVKSIGEALEKADLRTVALYQYIENDLKILLHEGKQVISATNATKHQANLLEVEEGQALLYMERVTYKLDGQPVEFLTSLARPDYVKYAIRLRR